MNDAPSYMPLLDCARRCGVRRRTFQRWLEKEGYSVQRNGRTALVPVQAFEVVIAKRTVVKRFSPALSSKRTFQGAA